MARLWWCTPYIFYPILYDSNFGLLYRTDKNRTIDLIPSILSGKENRDDSMRNFPPCQASLGVVWPQCYILATAKYPLEHAPSKFRKFNEFLSIFISSSRNNHRYGLHIKAPASQSFLHFHGLISPPYRCKVLFVLVQQLLQTLPLHYVLRHRPSYYQA